MLVVLMAVEGRQRLGQLFFQTADRRAKPLLSLGQLGTVGGPHLLGGALDPGMQVSQALIEPGFGGLPLLGLLVEGCHDRLQVVLDLIPRRRQLLRHLPFQSTQRRLEILETFGDLHAMGAGLFVQVPVSGHQRRQRPRHLLGHPPGRRFQPIAEHGQLLIKRLAKGSPQVLLHGREPVFQPAHGPAQLLLQGPAGVANV